MYKPTRAHARMAAPLATAWRPQPPTDPYGLCNLTRLALLLAPALFLPLLLFELPPPLNPALALQPLAVRVGLGLGIRLGFVSLFGSVPFPVTRVVLGAADDVSVAISLLLGPLPFASLALAFAPAVAGVE